MKNTKAKRKVYSYLRFSSYGQLNNDSIRRQREVLDRWLVAHPDYELDETLLLLDEAKSGFYGEHRKSGMLGLFLEKVKKGEIAPGSALLVENLDRLTREHPFSATQLCGDLIGRGIDIATEYMFYNKDSYAGGGAHVLIGEIQRGYRESKTKSDRVTRARDEAFKEARKSKKIVTSRGPAWLYKVGEHDWQVHDGAEETIKLIFAMKLEGYSNRAMRRRLKDEKRLVNPEAGLPKNDWYTGYIKKILANRAVLGEYQPFRKEELPDGTKGNRKPSGPPIHGYYPRVVDEDTFNKVQAILAKNKGKGGRTGKHLNIFRHLAKCGYCGGSMHHSNKGSGWRYLVCEKAERGLGCQYDTVRYMEAQGLILDACRHIDPAQVLPATAEQQTLVATLTKRAHELRAKLATRQEHIANGMDQIFRTSDADMRDSYEAHVQKLKKEVATLEPELRETEKELENATHMPDKFKGWQHALPDLMAAIDDPEAGTLRARLAAHLRNYIDRIEVFPVGFREVADPDNSLDSETSELVMLKGPVVKKKNGRRRRRHGKRAWLPHLETISKALESFWSEMEQRPTKKQRTAFERYVLGRRMSKEGRFYRICFKNGERIDVVPPGGLATGFRAIKGAIERVLPDFERLWKEFRKAKGEG